MSENANSIVSSSAVVTIEINGTSYLGTLDGNTFKGVTKVQGLVGYIKARETGAMETLIIGNNNNLILRPLTDEQQLDLDRLESLWKLAEAKSKSWVTSQVFAQLSGK
jgi:hypothetical protein